MARITQQQLAERLADLKAHGVALGIEGAEHWEVGNPFGPTGLHLLERRPDSSVSQNTALGTWRWSGPKEAHAALTAMTRALHAARLATEAGDRHSELHEAGTL